MAYFRFFNPLSDNIDKDLDRRKDYVSRSAGPGGLGNGPRLCGTHKRFRVENSRGYLGNRMRRHKGKA